MNRESALKQIGGTDLWDVVVVGAGATGLGAALDAVSRGYRTVLIEQADFGKATSSRSTKLSHGGVRYLRQGNIALVMEALKERGRMLRNAPHLVRRQGFLIPAASLWEMVFYGAGLKVYDALAGKASFGRSRMMAASAVRERMPSLSRLPMAGGVLYFDGQFDDARYCIALAQTMVDKGGAALNYARMVRLLKQNGRVAGVVARDIETGDAFDLPARVVINATGVFSDDVRRLDEPGSAPMLTVSQGSHFVLPKSFLPGMDALMVPRTSDGRVLFAIPWEGAVVVGTTDEPVPGATLEPRALPVEMEFLSRNIELCFGSRPKESDVLSMWSGLRPLIRKQGARSTAALSREHEVSVSASGLVSVAGGKWTTYRSMAEDAVDIAARSGGLPERASGTREMRLHGWSETAAERSDPGEDFSPYGADQAMVDALAAASPALGRALHPSLPYHQAQVVWAARYEMARTVEDVLARRTRSLFLNARAAIEAGSTVAAVMARELGRDERWQRQQVEDFTQLASSYIYRAQ